MYVNSSQTINMPEMPCVSWFEGCHVNRLIVFAHKPFLYAAYIRIELCVNSPRIMRKFSSNYAVKLLELCRQTICL